MAERRFDAADLALRRAMAAFPGDRDLLRLYAWSAHASARHGLAIERWREAMEAAPGDPLCHGALAANLREHGDLQGAEDAISQALPLFPNNIIVLTEAGRIAQARACYEQALAHWDKALELATPHPEWLRCRAETISALRTQIVGDKVEREPS